MAQQQDPERLAWADACRLIAMFGVIVIHTAAPIFYSYRTIALSDFLAANALDSIARVAVPLFAMLSGALLLGRDVKNGLGGVVGRVLKVALPLAFWSVIYVFWLNYWTGKPLSIPGALMLAFEGPVIYHLWFVYMIMGVYILLPILQVISVAMLTNERLAGYFFCIWFLINCLTIYLHVELIKHLTLSNFLNWPGYFLLGFYLTRSISLKNAPIWLSLSIFCLASLSTFLISWRLNSLSPIPTETAFEYFSPNVMVASCAAFHMIKQIRISARLVRPLAFLSSIIFPVYFMHLIVIDLIKAGMFGFTLNLAAMHAITAILSLSVATFLVSLGLAALTRIVPHTAKIVG